MSSKTGKKRKVSRPGYLYLGITPERAKELKHMCRSGAFDLETMRLACGGDLEFISKWLVLSVQRNLSYDDLEIAYVQGRIERIPCGRSNFYSYRRLFFRNLDEAIKGA